MKIGNIIFVKFVVVSIIFVFVMIILIVGLSDGFIFGECYNNWIFWCNEYIVGYLNSCYGESMDYCDGVYSVSFVQIFGYQVKIMKFNFLCKVKCVNVKFVMLIVILVCCVN